MAAQFQFRGLALSLLLQRSIARVIWIPEEFDSQSGRHHLASRRSTDTCAGLSGSFHCGTSYPADFCCPVDTHCVALNTTAATAVICCPQGSDCLSISTVSCSQKDQNAAIAPHNNLHSIPTEPLEPCGDSGCCPPGYDCDGSQCVAQGTATTSSTSRQASTAATHTSPTSTTSLGAGATQISTTTTATSSYQTSISPTSDRGDPGSSAAKSSNSSFNGDSFAAGLVPGIAIGVILAALLFFSLWRRQAHASPASCASKKPGRRDTLTDLSAVPEEKMFKHGRSISEPVGSTYSHRTDFLRSTPPRLMKAPATDSIDRSPIGKTPYSHSPFLEQMPSSPPAAKFPAHLKRGTLSFRISPVRALRKQRSIQSLRRHVRDAADATPSVSRSTSGKRLSFGCSRSRSRSTETIQVLMPSTEPYTPAGGPSRLPDQTPAMDEPSDELSDSSTTWGSDTSPAADVRPLDHTTPDLRALPLHVGVTRNASAQQTPTREPKLRSTERAGAANRLGSPYSPPGGRETKSSTKFPWQPPPLQIPNAPPRRDIPFLSVPMR